MNRSIKLAFAVIFVLAYCAACRAESWDEVKALAEKHNNELAASKKLVQAYEWSYKRAYSGFLPHLSANASMTESENSESDEPEKSYSLGLSATQSIFNGMQNIWGLETAYSDYQYYLASFRNTEANVYYDVRSAFIDLLVAGKNVDLLRQILEQRKENSRLIKLRYESGNEDKGNLMQTQADEADAKYNLSVAESELKLAKLKLSQLLSAEVVSAEADLAVESVQLEDIEALTEQSPAYIMAEYQLESAEIAKKSAISGFLPSLSLSGNWNKRGDEWPPEDTESRSWSLNLSYSFFPGGSNFVDAVIYDLRLEKAKQDFEKSTKETRYSIEEAYENFKNSVQALEVKEFALKASGTRAKIGKAKYLNGLLTFDEWNRIEDEYISAQNGLLSSRRNALMAEASWLKSYGGYVK